MSDRSVTLLGALAAFLLVGGLLLGGDDGSGRVPVSRPRSQDAGDAGLLGAWRWLESSGVSVQRLRQRYSGLDALGAPAAGNLLVIAEPMVYPPRHAEREQLRRWVGRGNHVLLLASGAQAIAWQRSGPFPEGSAHDALQLESQWDDDAEAAEDDAGADDGAAVAPPAPAPCADPQVTHGTIAGPLRRLRPPPHRRGHPVLAGVREVAVKARPAPVATRLGHADAARLSSPLLCDPQLEAPVFSVLRLGEGRIWLSDYSELFANLNLDRADNARLLANLVGQALGPGGQIIFDDMHQGDSVLYDPAAFFADPRLHGSAGFLLAIWLLWLLAASNRFAPPRAAPPGLSGLDFVRALGGFYARHLRPHEAALGLYRHFFNRIRARFGAATDGTPAWALLARAPRVAAAGVRELHELHGQLQRGRKVDLKRLRNLILNLEQSLT